MTSLGSMATTKRSRGSYAPAPAPTLTTIRKITPAGVVSTVVGVAGPTVVGNFPGTLPASIVLPTGGVAIDPSSGKLYITLPDAVMVASISN